MVQAPDLLTICGSADGHPPEDSARRRHVQAAPRSQRGTPGPAIGNQMLCW